MLRSHQADPLKVSSAAFLAHKFSVKASIILQSLQAPPYLSGTPISASLERNSLKAWQRWSSSAKNCAIALRCRFLQTYLLMAEPALALELAPENRYLLRQGPYYCNIIYPRSRCRRIR